LSFEYFAGRLFCQQIRNNEKSLYGQTQLSVSDPNLPIDVGGAPQTHIRKVSVTKEVLIALIKRTILFSCQDSFGKEALNRVMFS
jgi:hypothetical protein